MELPKELTTVTTTSKILAAIVFVSLPFAAFFIGATYQASIATKSTDSTVVSTPKTSTSSATTSATANWKTYSNSTLGFTLKYPNSWSVADNLNGSVSIESADFRQDDKNKLEEQATSGAKIFISTSSVSTLPTRSVGQVIKGSDTVTDKEVLSVKSITVDGKSGIEWDFQEKGNPAFTGTIAKVLNNAKTYEIEIIYSSKTSKDIFDQILSTFKFTDQSQTDSTANWKTYKITSDSSLGYESYQIKLPSTWKQVEHSSNFHGTEVFQDEQSVYKLSIREQKNYNDQTKKPYASLKELGGSSYDRDTLNVGSQQAVKVLPRAGAENTYGVSFFSKDEELVYSIALDTPVDGSKVREGETVFNQILSTFQFTK
ncbi:MAG: hypothetical protein M1150_03235 [Patescibacteria group bacterium]|nr:hypothetical protein [Patescibacteria group bacterium]